jgi:hypothetical protein
MKSMLITARSHRRASTRALLTIPLLGFVLSLSGCAEEQSYYPRGDRERVYRSARADGGDYYRDGRRDDYRRDDYQQDDDNGARRRRYEREDRRDYDEDGADE